MPAGGLLQVLLCHVGTPPSRREDEKTMENRSSRRMRTRPWHPGQKADAAKP